MVWREAPRERGVFSVRLYDSVDSTSDEAGRLAAEGAPHGTVVAAREQTAGRGRSGRRWSSPPGNVYISLLLRLDLTPGQWAELSFVAALAVADTIEAFGCPARLKWPNDVLVRDAKIAGILVEHEDTATILGIGVNVGHCPPDTPYPVTSLTEARRASAPPDPPTPPVPPQEDGEVSVASVRARLLLALARRLDLWLAAGFVPIRDEWLRRAHPLGTTLRVDAIEGAFAGLDPNGALLLDTPYGRRRIVAGEAAQLR